MIYMRMKGHKGGYELQAAAACQGVGYEKEGIRTAEKM
jgi:hypothetical protein